MKKFYGFILAIALIVGGLTPASAQKVPCGFSIQLGGLLPIQQFNDATTYFIPGANSMGNHGNAMFGASFGLKYNYRFDFGLGIFCSVDGMWNMLNKSARDLYDQASCTSPMYVNIPIMLGLSYISDFSYVFDVWAEAGAGCNLFWKTNEGWENNLTKYLWNPAFAAEGGIGVRFVKTISLGVHYYWLGNNNIKVEGVTYDSTFNTPPKMKVGMLAFKLGLHF